MSCITCQQAAANIMKAASKASNIIDGYSNLIITDPEVEKIALARLEVCMKCPFKKELIKINGIQHYTCNKCKCPLDAKVRAVNEVCPDGRW